MAISLDPSALPPSAPPTLLATLRAYTRLLETRRALQAELDSALSSFLSGSPTPLPPSDPLAAATADAPTPAAAAAADAPAPAANALSTCASEAIRPPSQPELAQALQIGFGGLVELKEEARLLMAQLGDKWARDDLRRVVERVEGWESERMRAVSRHGPPLGAERVVRLSSLRMNPTRSRCSTRTVADVRPSCRRSSEIRCAACRPSSPSWTLPPRSPRRMPCASAFPPFLVSLTGSH